MKWHQLNNDGSVAQTVTAPDKQTALALCGGGTVVSAISYRLDVYKFRPVQTVVTDIEQTQYRKPTPQYTYKKGWLRLAQIAQKVEMPQNKLRHLIDRWRLPCKVVCFGGRRVRFYHPVVARQIQKRVAERQKQ